jgi:YgiT-type zinc finger domain-containing protein
MIEIRRCPTCGSDKIKKVRRNWTDDVEGKVYAVPDLEFYECPICQEHVFDRDAMRRIEAHSPAFSRTRRMKRSA